MFDLQFEPFVVGRRLAVITGTKGSGYWSTTVVGALELVIDRIDGEGDVGAVLFQTEAEDTFVAGLDFDELSSLTDRRDIEGFAQRTQRLLARIGSGRRPWVSAVQGRCLDVGLELLLVSRAVVCADTSATRLGLPQIRTGLPPVAGGTTRLRRQLGLSTAVELLLGGNTISAARALDVGLVHAVVRPEALRAQATALARDGSEHEGEALGRRLVQRVAKRTQLGSKRQLRQMRSEWQERDPVIDPARLAILDLTARGLSLSEDDALRLEPPMFAELAVSASTRARLSVRASANRLRARLEDDEVTRRRVERIGLVGAGAVGGDLAVVAAEAGASVRLREKDPVTLGRAMGRIERGLAKLGARRTEAEMMRTRARLSGSLDLRGFDSMDLVVEAVPETLIVKRRVFAELEDRVPARTILATHPRVHPVGAVGAKMRHPERLVGFRCFRPLHRMELCEIAAGPKTSARALSTVLAFARRIGKTPVVVRDAPGFFTTRVLAVYLGAAIQLVESGHRIEDVDLGARRSGWPIGPLRLLDSIGLEVAVHVSLVLCESLGPRAAVPAGLSELVDRGRGFYVRGPGEAARPDPRVYDSIGVVGARPVDPDDLGERLTLVAALEAVRCLQEGVIDSARDGNVAAVLGLGYPAFRGGPFRHLAARGLASMRNRLTALESRFGAAFAPPPLLVELARQGRDFESIDRGAQ